MRTDRDLPDPEGASSPFAGHTVPRGHTDPDTAAPAPREHNDRTPVSFGQRHGAEPAVADDAAVDGELLQAHIAGDATAFAMLVRRHERWMWMTARAMLGDRDDAMDAVQQALIRALRSAHTWRGDGSVKSWLRRIVHRVALDLQAARARLPVPVPAEGDPTFEAMTARDDLPDTSAEKVLQEAIAALPLDQRECFVRIDLLGFTYSEAAHDLNIPEGTVKSRRARGKARLVEALREAELVGPSRRPSTPGPGTGRSGEGELLPPTEPLPQGERDTGTPTGRRAVP